MPFYATDFVRIRNLSGPNRFEDGDEGMIVGDLMKRVVGGNAFVYISFDEWLGAQMFNLIRFSWYFPQKQVYRDLGIQFENSSNIIFILILIICDYADNLNFYVSMRQRLP